MSQQLVYILLGAAFLIFIVMTVRDWALQRRRYQEKGVPAGAAKDASLPLELQAYERLVVLLERMKPENLIARVNAPGAGAAELRIALIRTVQSEYEHNISQQIYVSTEAWDAVATAKEQLVSLVNSLAEKLPAEAEGKDLAKQLLEVSLREADFPVNTALRVLNAEAKKLMGRPASSRS